uniref:Uncharacterized protein n=1 Tax=viral metagenome TaxID=1070528 RepID=A0A6M3M1Y3_9ZZZZ
MTTTEQRDPVHMDPDGQWYFYNETWDGRYGPYPTPDEARAQMKGYIEWLNSQKPPQPEEPKPQSEADIAVAEYLKLREMKAKLADEQKKAMKEIQDQLDKADAWLLGRMQEMGVESFKAGGATVFFASELRAGIGDKGALMDYIRQTGEVEILQSRVSSTVIREWMDRNGGHTPPGVSASFERVVRVRKS